MKPYRWIIFFTIGICSSNAQISDFKNIDFSKADSLAMEFNGQNLQNLPLLVNSLTNGLTSEAEQFRALYMWVCNNIANDYRLYDKNMRKRQRFKHDSIKLAKWNEQFKGITLKRLLKKNKTICTGYAYLLKELADLINIDCKIIHGFARTSTIPIESLDLPNHSWNAVKLNNKWYLCDPTWASGIQNPNSLQFKFRFNEGFFLSAPELFALNHFPVNEDWLLINNANKPDFNDFLQAPILYTKAYEKLSVHIEPKFMHTDISRNTTVQFKYKLKSELNDKKLKLLIDSGSSSRKVTPSEIDYKENFLSFSYTFKNRGFYDVHLYIEEDLITTYTFKVNKQ